MKIYSKNNFHKHTFCLWQEVSIDVIEGFMNNHTSKSGSSYIFVEKGVYRISNHWGRVSNCRWRLLPLENYKNQQIKVGFAAWIDFYPNDEDSKLFFVEVDYKTNAVSFYHKLSPNYEKKNILLSAAETSKKIKIIKEILTETSWTKHLKFEEITTLRKQIVEELLYTEKTFFEIKKVHL